MLWLQDLSRCRSFGMYVQNILLYYTHVMFLFLHLYWSNTIFLLVRHFLMLSGPKGILLNPNIVRLLQWQQYNGYSLSPIWRRQSWLFSLTHPFLFHLFSHSPDHFQFGHTTLIISPLCRFYSQLCTSIIGLCTVSTLINHGLISSTQWIITSTATPAGTCFIPTWGKKSCIVSAMHCLMLHLINSSHSRTRDTCKSRFPFKRTHLTVYSLPWNF